MKAGKVSETVLKRSIFKQIKHRREEVLVKPGVGEDCSVIELAQDQVFVISTDPITGTVHDIGKLAVHITANDIASSGADLIGIMLTVLLPLDSSESDLKAMMKEIEETCMQLDIEVVGGHTEVTGAVNQPIISVTGIGKMDKKDIITTAGLIPGQDIVMTKWVGLEGTAILAKDQEEKLLTRYTGEFIAGAKEFINHISVVKEAKIARTMEVTAMHDVTEGGVFGALWEMAAASKTGLEIDLKKIPIKQETVEICEFFDLSPYMLMSSGSMLIATNRGSDLVQALKEAGIPSAVIGKVTAGNDRVIINEEERRFLEPPKSDELYKVI